MPTTVRHCRLSPVPASTPSNPGPLHLTGWTDFTPASETAKGESPVESVTVEVPAGIVGKKLFVRVVAVPVPS